MVTAVLYLLASLCGGLASHWAYTKLLLKHTSWTTTERFPSRPYGDLEMQSGREHPAPGEAGTPAAKLRAGGQPDFEAIPAIERMAVRFPLLLLLPPDPAPAPLRERGRRGAAGGEDLRRVRAAGDETNLVQRAVRRAGHCDFSLSESIRTLLDMTDWVGRGLRPEGEDLSGDLVAVGVDFTVPFDNDDPLGPIDRG